MSDYFAAMFTSDVREAKQDEVKMEGVDPDALWVLVQYAYTGNRDTLTAFIRKKRSKDILAGFSTFSKKMYL